MLALFGSAKRSSARRIAQHLDQLRYEKSNVQGIFEFFRDTTMNMLSTEPGLITRIENGSMYVKVPVGLGCNACPKKTACTFSGPERAYRTFRVHQAKGCIVGDRVLVHVPGVALAVMGLVLIILPVVLILAGYGLLTCCVLFPYATVVLWVVGVALWLASMYGANYWMEHAVQFRERVQTVDELRHESERTRESITEERERL
jgi:positive regulator of sigma E activity